MHLLQATPIFFLLTRHLPATRETEIATCPVPFRPCFCRERLIFSCSDGLVERRSHFPASLALAVTLCRSTWPKRNAPKGTCSFWGLPLKGRSAPSPCRALLSSGWNAPALGSPVGPSRPAPAPAYQERGKMKRAYPT